VRAAVGIVIAVALIAALLSPPRRPEFLATVSRECYSYAAYLFPQTRVRHPISRAVLSAAAHAYFDCYQERGGPGRVSAYVRL